MKKIIVFNRITLDGFFAGTNGEIDWFVQDPELDQKMMFDKKVGQPDTILFGRKTYEMFEGYWPKVEAGASDLEFSPQGEEALREERKIAALLTKMNKIVFSRKPRQVYWENSRVMNNNLIEEVQRIKKGDGNGIIIFGSGSLVQQLTNQDLIDEYLLILTPVVLGKGKPLFNNVERSSFRLNGVETYKTGNVLLHYKR